MYNKMYARMPAYIFTYVFPLASTVEPGYDDVGLYDASFIPTDILWCPLNPHS
jgi:hypothetical protein